MKDRRPVKKDSKKRHNCDWRELYRPQVSTAAMLKNVNGAAGGAGIGYATAQSQAGSYVAKSNTTTATVLAQA